MVSAFNFQLNLRRHKCLSPLAFTLLEMLVAVALTAIVMVALSSLLGMLSRSYRTTVGNLDSYEAGRAALELVRRTVSQATLLSYFGYDDPLRPTAYVLRSDLHFISGPKSDLGLATPSTDRSHAAFFQAPLGVTETASLQASDLLLVATGFFIAHGDDPLLPASLNGKVPNRKRYRLFQYMQPREKMTVYENTLGQQDGVTISNPAFSGSDWFAPDVNALRYCRPLAENVVFMAMLPVSEGLPAEAFLWNTRDSSASRNRLPESLKIVMAMIDEKSATRLGDGETPPQLVPSGLFEDADQFDNDVGRLDEALAAHSPPLNFRIFTAEVSVSQ